MVPAAGATAQRQGLPLDFKGLSPEPSLDGHLPVDVEEGQLPANALIESWVEHAKDETPFQ